MDEAKFKEIEEKYKELKEQLDRDEITSDEMKMTLKELMVLDENGSYWMIGGKTGKWYLYDGAEWKEDNPYKEDPSETKMFPPSTEDASKDDTAEVEKIESIGDFEKSDEFKETEYKIEEDEPKIEKAEPEVEKVEPEIKEEKVEKKEFEITTRGVSTSQIRDGELLIKSVKVTSMIFFLGGFGLGLGVIFGAIFGIFPILGDLIYRFGPMLAETHGKIQGGLIFAAIGGFGGFIVFSIIAVIFSWLYNAISSLVGGVRFKVKF